MLRREFVERKLHLIAEDLARLSDFRDISHEELTGDYVRLAAVERMIERIVLRAIDANEHLIVSLATGAEDRSTRLTYRETFLELAEHGIYDREFAERIAGSVGLRNILVHEYNDLDHHILHGSIRGVLERFTIYVDAVQAFLNREG